MIQILHHMFILHCVHVQLLKLFPSAPQQVLARLEIVSNCVDLVSREVDLRGDFSEQLHGLEAKGSLAGVRERRESSPTLVSSESCFPTSSCNFLSDFLNSFSIFNFSFSRSSLFSLASNVLITDISKLLDVEF